MAGYIGSKAVNLSTTGADINGDANIDGDLSFGDNDKAVFGAGSDLQIYHDGSNSYISDQGTGNIILDADDSFQVKRGANTSAYFDTNAEVTLYHNNATKLATTSTGVDITGVLSSDGLTVDGDGTFSATNPTVDIKATNGNDASLILMETTGNDFGANGANGFRSRYDGGDNALYIQSGAETTIRNRIKVDRDTGDISFYEDTGTTPKFFWDASAESLGIGTSSPNDKLTISGSAAYMTIDRSDGEAGVTFRYNGDNTKRADIATQTNGDLSFRTNLAEAMRIDSSGNVGIGTSSPVMQLQSAGGIAVSSDSSLTQVSRLYESFGLHIDSGDAAGNTRPIIFRTGGTERMRLDASGDLLVGTTSTTANDGGISTKIRGSASSSTSYFQFRRGTSTNAAGTVLAFFHGGTVVGSVTHTNTSTTYGTSSDHRLKTDAQPMTGASARVQALNPVNFEWVADGTRVDGFLAHEAQEVVPEAVTGEKDAVDADGNPEYQGIDQSKLVPLLTAALQEALDEITDLKARVATLEAN